MRTNTSKHVLGAAPLTNPYVGRNVSVWARAGQEARHMARLRVPRGNGNLHNLTRRHCCWHLYPEASRRHRSPARRRRSSVSNACHHYRLRCWRLNCGTGVYLHWGHHLLGLCRHHALPRLHHALNSAAHHRLMGLRSLTEIVRSARRQCCNVRTLNPRPRHGEIYISPKSSIIISNRLTSLIGSFAWWTQL